MKKFVFEGIKVEKQKSAASREVLTVHVDNNMEIVSSDATQGPARVNVSAERYVCHCKI